MKKAGARPAFLGAAGAYCARTHFTRVFVSSSDDLTAGWPLPDFSLATRSASAVALRLYFLATSLNAGPIFFVSTASQFLQPLFRARSALACATPATESPTAASTANVNDFIESPCDKPPC